MENCTIYSHQLDFEKIVAIVKANLPKAEIEYNDGGMQKSLVATIKGGFFSKPKTLKINYRERKIPSYKLEEIECGLTQNLSGMVGFIQNIPAQNSELNNKFLFKVMAANCEMPFMVEPEITSEFEAILKTIVQEIDAFIFAQPSKLFRKSNSQHFVDKNFKLILDLEGRSEIEDIDVNINSKYFDLPKESYVEDQEKRKENSENFLSSNGIKVNKNLPCIESENSVQLRSKQEIIDRAFALLIIAAKGEGIEQEHLEKAIEGKKIDSFTETEAQIYRAQSLNETERAYATWRYESLYVLLWALGAMDELKYPSDICNVQAVVGSIFQPSREEFEKLALLREKNEILDQLDLIYRMNWACVDARIKGEHPSGNINPSVIYERHYALNWLTRYMDQDWDNVQTDT